MIKPKQSSDYKLISTKLQASASRLIAAAYYDNPAHIYLFPDDKSRLSKLEWLLGLNLKLQLKHGAESFCYPESGVVQAMGFWTRPNEIKVGHVEKVRGGLLKVPFKFGWKTFSRIMEASAGIDEHLSRTLGKKQAYRYLNNMVMEEAHQAKGWGTRILEKQFEDISERTPNAILALSTQRHWTVKFYERLGFEVLLEDSIGTGPLAFTNWIMRKQL